MMIIKKTYYLQSFKIGQQITKQQRGGWLELLCQKPYLSGSLL